MQEYQELLRQISETITRIDELREQSAEVREALALQAKQEALVKRLQEQGKEIVPQIVPYPYPVYPPYPWWQPSIITIRSDIRWVYEPSTTLAPNSFYEEKP